MTSFCRWWVVGLGLAVFAAAAGAAAPSLPLHGARASAYDLAVTGRLRDGAVTEPRYVRWADLRAMPTERITVTGEFTAGEQVLTVVWVADLWAALPAAEDADVIFAACTDGYASVYRKARLPAERPMLVLEIDGRGPEHWPPAGLSFNPGPFVITVSATVAPAVAELLDANHKRPWGVTTIEFAREAEKLAALPGGAEPTATLSAAALAGREIWIHSCLSCHTGPRGSFGGVKSDRPFEVLAAHATFNAPYFKKYVRDPKSAMPGAKMEPHAHYTDEQLDALVAFLGGGTKSADPTH